MGNKETTYNKDGSVKSYKHCDKTQKSLTRTACKCGNVDYYCADWFPCEKLGTNKSWKKTKHIREKKKINYEDMI